MDTVTLSKQEYDAMMQIVLAAKKATDAVEAQEKGGPDYRELWAEVCYQTLNVLPRVVIENIGKIDLPQVGV